MAAHSRSSARPTNSPNSSNGRTALRHVGRAKWITLQTLDALPARETRRLLLQSYDLIVSKMPRKNRPA